MSAQPDEYDPDATVWEAVAELERKGFTKRETADVLRDVTETLLDETATLKNGRGE